MRSIKNAAAALALALAVALTGAASVDAQRIDAAAAGPMWDAAISPGGTRLATGCRSDGDRAICLYNLDTFTAEAVLPAPDGASLRSFFWASDTYLIYAIRSRQRMGTPWGVRDYELRRPVAFNAETGANTLLLRAYRNLEGGDQITSLLRDQPDQVAIELTIRGDDEPETGSRIAKEPDRRSVVYRVDLDSGGIGRILERAGASTIQIALDPSGEPYAQVRNRENGAFEIIAIDGRDRRTVLEGEGGPYPAVVLGRIPGAQALGVQVPGAGLRRVDLATGEVAPFDRAGDPIVDMNRAELVGFDVSGVYPRQAFLDEGLAATKSALINALGAETVTLQAWSDDRQMMLIAAHGDGAPDFYLFDAEAGELSAFEP